MKVFKVKTEWSRYSRGTATYLVEAETEAKAKKSWTQGEEIDRDVVKVATESEITSVKEDILEDK